MAKFPMVRRMWGRGAVLAAVVLAGEGSAAAEGFRYVDRDGVAHNIEVAGASPAAPGPAHPAPALDAGGEYPYAASVQEAARLYTLPVELILAVMTVESAFEPRAVSPRGAMGLMQVMPATAAEMKIADPFDPRANIMGGARYLRILLNGTDGDVTLALGSYNAGMGAAQRYGGVPPFRDTHQYVTSVIRFYKMYQERGPGFAAVVASTIRGKKSAGAPAQAAPPVVDPVAPPPAPPIASQAAAIPAAYILEEDAGRVASPDKTVVLNEKASVRSAPGKKHARPRRSTRHRRDNG